MAQSYQLINAQTLTSGAQSITFSNIPQNYTDLRILFSARVDTSGGYSNVKIGFNGSTSNITWRAFYAYSGSSTGANTGGTERVAGNANANSSTSSTFSNADVYITDYTSTTYAKTISGESVVESNDSTNPLLSFDTNYWNPGTQAAITSITLSNSASPAADFVSGSTFYLYGIGGTRATGGTITADGAYTYHTFTSTSTFIANEKIKNAEALVIAGGGGGARRHGGGGGAGGVSHHNYQTFMPGSSYTVTVGAGGAGATSSGAGVVGNNSVFSAITSNGGGRGIQDAGAANSTADGGSGGGRANYGTAGTVGGSATQGNTGGAIGYGNNGGAGKDNGSNSLAAGGGGGAGAVGETAPTTTQPGKGGDGLNTWSAWATATSTGVSGYYAGGGGGSSFSESTFGTGGAGGGGAGNSTGAATAGTANTGSGGGGQGNDNANAGSGGSGLVIIRYPNS
jgi:hypothetical protein